MLGRRGRGKAKVLLAGVGSPIQPVPPWEPTSEPVSQRLVHDVHDVHVTAAARC